MNETIELTLVGVYSERRRDFIPTLARRVICPECGARNDGDAMWWDEVCPGEPFLQCECGEQFYTRSESA